MDEKFLLLEQGVAKRAKFDAEIRYDDFVTRNPAIETRSQGLRLRLLAYYRGDVTDNGKAIDGNA